MEMVASQVSFAKTACSKQGAARPGSAHDPRWGHRLPVAVRKPPHSVTPPLIAHSNCRCDSKKNISCPKGVQNPWTTALLPTRVPASQKPLCFSLQLLPPPPQLPLPPNSPSPPTPPPPQLPPTPTPVPCKFCSLSSRGINPQPLRAKILLILPGTGFPWQPKALLCHL